MLEGTFPEIFKTSKVVPIFKNGDDQEPENYRQIHILPGFSKILETIIAPQIIDYYQKFELFCNKALINNVHTPFENKENCITRFTDLSRSFDSVNHQNLYDNLDAYGIRAIGNASIINCMVICYL